MLRVYLQADRDRFDMRFSLYALGVISHSIILRRTLSEAMAVNIPESVDKRIILYTSTE